MNNSVVSPSALIEFIDPLRAQAILAKNTRNRPLRKSVVRTYAQEMASGRWHPHLPICIDSDGDLLDGQHRLSAVVECGIGQWFTVIKSLARDAFSAIDGGVKRTNADALTIGRNATNANALASIVRMTIMIESRGNLRAVSSGRCLDRFDATPELFQGACALANDLRKRLPLPGSAIGASMVLIASKPEPNEDLVDMLQAAASGVGLGEGCAELALGRWRTVGARGSAYQLEALAAIGSALARKRKGAHVMNLKSWRTTSGYPFDYDFWLPKARKN